jgi:Tfp pilus assembly protein PilV
MHRNAFTFVETLACLMVVTFGVMAAIGVILSGINRTSEAQATATGLATAMSAAYDADQSLADAGVWTSSGSGTATGYINGYYVKRTETATSSALDIPTASTTSHLVEVEVYDQRNGRPVASFTTRILRSAAP